MLVPEKQSNVLVFTFDFFGEFDPVRVCEWPRLLINVVDVQHFTHELNDRLGLVKGSGRHYKERKKQKTKNRSVLQKELITT